MIIEKTEIQMQKHKLMKAARAAIRLKHMLAADEECNRVLPGLEKLIDAAITSGEPFELSPGKLFDEA